VKTVRWDPEALRDMRRLDLQVARQIRDAVVVAEFGYAIISRPEGPSDLRQLVATVVLEEMGCSQSVLHYTVKCPFVAGIARIGEDAAHVFDGAVLVHLHFDHLQERFFDSPIMGIDQL